MLIIGVYGPPGQDETANKQFFEDEVFSILDNTTYDKVIIVGDWNVFLDPQLDQIKHVDPTNYRAKTRELIKSKRTVHSLIDIYRGEKLQKKEYTYLDKTGAKQPSIINYFLVDQETAAHTNNAKIKNICTPFEHSQITIEIYFDKVLRGPGYWKLNNSHIKN